MTTALVTIHCKLSALDDIKEIGLPYSFNDKLTEIDVLVEDKPDLDDEDFLNYYQLDYDLVNCIEAFKFCAV